MSHSQPDSYQAILVVSFGGPEKREDVIPFLENVLRGRSVPRERMLEVAEHYYHFGGVSPINAQNRALVKALEAELALAGPPLPVYWGNRNWHPLLPDTLRSMARDGIRRALAFFTSAYSSYSSCRQYQENIAAARIEVGEGAPEVDHLRAYFNHPGFIGPASQRVLEALALIPSSRRAQAPVAYTAHSIPLSMSISCDYVRQLQEACRLVSEAVQLNDWALVYQSRSGAPGQAWLEPDVRDHLRELARRGATDVVVAPIGFISDHLEVLFDLGVEAKGVADQSGLNMVRAGTVGTHPEFVRMIRQLVLERVDPASNPPQALGILGPAQDVCPPECCPLVARPGRSC